MGKSGYCLSYLLHRAGEMDRYIGNRHALTFSSLSHGTLYAAPPLEAQRPLFPEKRFGALHAGVIAVSIAAELL